MCANFRYLYTGFKYILSRSFLFHGYALSLIFALRENDDVTKRPKHDLCRDLLDWFSNKIYGVQFGKFLACKIFLEMAYWQIR
jgi:hypothetical protein